MNNLKQKINEQLNLEYIVIFLLFAAGFFTDPLFSVDSNFIPIRMFDILLVAVLIIYLKQLWEQKSGLISKDRIYLYYSLFILWTGLSILWGSSLIGIVKEVGQNVELLLFVLLITYIARKVELNQLLRLLYIAIIVITITFILLNFMNGNFINIKNSRVKTIPGFAAALTFGYFLFKEDKLKWGLILFWFSLFTLLTLERKSWVAFGWAGLFQFTAYNIWLTRQQTKKTNLNLAAILIVCLLIGTILFNVSPLVHKQIMSLTTVFTDDVEYSRFNISSNIQRKLILKAALFAFKDKPVLGIGVDNEEQAYKRIIETSDQFPPYTKIHGAHNEFARIAVELGGVGLGLFLLMWSYPVIGTLKRLIKYKDRLSFAYKQNGIFILGIWGYGVMVNMFKGSGLLNMMFLFTAIALYLVYKREVDNLFASKEGAAQNVT